MRRALLLLLMLTLPFQFVWGAAASYCQHEPSAATVNHFGHHVHKHLSKAISSTDSTSDKKVSVTDDDPDCASCHLTCVSPVSQPVQVFVVSDVEPAFTTPRTGHPNIVPFDIERPKWSIAA